MDCKTLKRLLHRLNIMDYIDPAFISGSKPQRLGDIKLQKLHLETKQQILAFLVNFWPNYIYKKNNFCFVSIQVQFWENVLYLWHTVSFEVFRSLHEYESYFLLWWQNCNVNLLSIFFVKSQRPLCDFCHLTIFFTFMNPLATFCPWLF